MQVTHIGHNVLMEIFSFNKQPNIFFTCFTGHAMRRMAFKMPVIVNQSFIFYINKKYMKMIAKQPKRHNIILFAGRVLKP